MVVQEENTKLPILHYSSAPRLPKGYLSALICSQGKEWKWSHNLASNHVLVCSQGTQASELPKLLNKSGGKQIIHLEELQLLLSGIWGSACGTTLFFVLVWNTIPQDTCPPLLQDTCLFLLLWNWCKKSLDQISGTGQILTLYSVAIFLTSIFCFSERYKSLFTIS